MASFHDRRGKPSGDRFLLWLAVLVASLAVLALVAIGDGRAAIDDRACYTRYPAPPVYAGVVFPPPIYGPYYTQPLAIDFARCILRPSNGRTP